MGTSPGGPKQEYGALRKVQYSVIRMPERPTRKAVIADAPLPAPLRSHTDLVRIARHCFLQARPIRSENLDDLSPKRIGLGRAVQQHAGESSRDICALLTTSTWRQTKAPVGSSWKHSRLFVCHHFITSVPLRQCYPSTTPQASPTDPTSSAAATRTRWVRCLAPWIERRIRWFIVAEGLRATMSLTVRRQQSCPYRASQDNLGIRKLARGHRDSEGEDKGSSAVGRPADAAPAEQGGRSCNGAARLLRRAGPLECRYGRCRFQARTLQANSPIRRSAAHEGLGSFKRVVQGEVTFQGVGRG